MDELLTFSAPIDPNSWELNSLPKMDKRQSRLWSAEDIQQAAVLQYEIELAHWTRYLPPGISRSYITQHLPKSLVKTVAADLPLEEMIMSISPASTLMESPSGDRISVPSSDSVFGSTSRPNSQDDIKPKHKHHNPFKPALKSLKRTMTLSKRKDTTDGPSTPPGQDISPSNTLTGSLTRTSTRRRALL